MVTYILIPSMIPMALAAFGLAFLIYAQINKTWLPPLVSFILLISATILAIGGDFRICEGITCTDYQYFIPALTYVFGGLAILAIVILFLRVLENFGDKNINY